MGRAKIKLDLKQIEALSGRGLNEGEICDVIGISNSTLGRRKKDSADFADAIKRGRSQSHAVIANALYELAKGGNLGAIVWYEKTRCGLTEDRIFLDRIEAIERLLEDKNK